MEYAKMVRKCARPVLHGLLMAIDPGSNYPGWAVFKKGELFRSGVIELPVGSSIQQRLRALHDTLQETSPDVLVIERLSKTPTTHIHLLWSVGVIVSATNAPWVLECPISTWKAWAGKEHKKSDEADAIAMGGVTIDIARGGTGGSRAA